MPNQCNIYGKLKWSRSNVHRNVKCAVGAELTAVGTELTGAIHQFDAVDLHLDVAVQYFGAESTGVTHQFDADDLLFLLPSSPKFVEFQPNFLAYHQHFV